MSGEDNFSEARLYRAAFDLWIQSNAGDNLADLQAAKRALHVVLEECVSETQRKYIIDYFVEKLTIPQIAEKYGKNKATVSVTIRRGLDNAYRYLRFVSPLFIRAPRRRGYLSNR